MAVHSGERALGDPGSRAVRRESTGHLPFKEMQGKSRPQPTGTSQTTNYTSPCSLGLRGVMCFQGKFAHVFGGVRKIELAQLAQASSALLHSPSVAILQRRRWLMRCDFGEGAEHHFFADTWPGVLVWIEPCPSQSIATRSRSAVPRGSWLPFKFPDRVQVSKHLG